MESDNSGLTQIFTQGEHVFCSSNVNSFASIFSFHWLCVDATISCPYHFILYNTTEQLPTFAVIIWVCGQLNVGCWTECSPRPFYFYQNILIFSLPFVSGRWQIFSKTCTRLDIFISIRKGLRKAKMVKQVWKNANLFKCCFQSNFVKTNK